MQDEIGISLSSLIEQVTGEAFVVDSYQSCDGGCIHQSGVYCDAERCYFVKRNHRAAAGMFSAEARGLEVLGKARTLRVPEVIGHAVVGDQALLVLEALDLRSRPDASSWARLGVGLAKLHLVSSDRYGFETDNFIGSSPQSNRRHASWTEFFIEERLAPQFEIAASKGMAFAGAEDLMGRAEEMLADHRPEPSLLHGDLWSGNVSFMTGGEPVIFDPAVYYGDRETDLAFTEFFGGFGSEFYRAYREAWPLNAGYEKRRELYNLYHVINHANLFGGGYVSQAEAMMRSLIG